MAAGMRDQGLVMEAGDAIPREHAPAAKRRLPIGAEPQPQGGVHFRVWAPACRDIAARIAILPADRC